MCLRVFCHEALLFDLRGFVRVWLLAFLAGYSVCCHEALVCYVPWGLENCLPWLELGFPDCLAIILLHR